MYIALLDWDGYQLPHIQRPSTGFSSCVDVRLATSHLLSWLSIQYASGVAWRQCTHPGKWWFGKCPSFHIWQFWVSLLNCRGGKLCTTFDHASQELQLQQVVNLYHLWTFGSWLSGKKSDDSSSPPRKQSDHLLGRDVLDGNRSIPGNSMTKMIATGCQSKGAEEKYIQTKKEDEGEKRKGELELGKWLTNVYLALVGDAKKTQKILEGRTGTVGESSDQF